MASYWVVHTRIDGFTAFLNIMHIIATQRLSALVNHLILMSGFSGQKKVMLVTEEKQHKI